MPPPSIQELRPVELTPLLAAGFEGPVFFGALSTLEAEVLEGMTTNGSGPGFVGGGGGGGGAGGRKEKAEGRDFFVPLPLPLLPGPCMESRSMMSNGGSGSSGGFSGSGIGHMCIETVQSGSTTVSHTVGRMISPLGPSRS